MREKEFYKLQATCKMNGIELYRAQYLRGYKYFLNGKLQKSICDMYKNINDIIKKQEVSA